LFLQPKTKHQKDAANELKAEFGDRVEVLQADLTDPGQTKEMVEKAVAALGGLDVLINNAWPAAKVDTPGRWLTQPPKAPY